MQRELLRIINVDFDANRQLLTMHPAFVMKKYEYREVHQLYTNFKKVYDSNRRKVLYNTGLFISPSGIPNSTAQQPRQTRQKGLYQ